MPQNGRILRYLVGAAVKAVHQGCAGQARIIPARPEHKVVQDERRFVGEQLRQTDGLAYSAFGRPVELVILVEASTWWQLAAHCRDLPDLVNQGLFFPEQRIARVPVFLVLVRVPWFAHGSAPLMSER